MHKCSPRGRWIKEHWQNYCLPDSVIASQITKFIGPTWGPHGSCWPQMGPMLAPWNLAIWDIPPIRSGSLAVAAVCCFVLCNLVSSFQCNHGEEMWGAMLASIIPVSTCNILCLAWLLPMTNTAHHSQLTDMLWLLWYPSATWWCHYMETLSTLLAFHDIIIQSPVNSSHERQSMMCFDVSLLLEWKSYWKKPRRYAGNWHSFYAQVKSRMRMWNHRELVLCYLWAITSIKILC